MSEKNFFKISCLLEAVLLLVAGAIGWATDINPFKNVHYLQADVFFGLVAIIPLFIIFILLYRLPISSLQQIKSTLLQTIAPLIYRYHWSDLLVLAVVVGISEEILFRGILQPWLENSWGSLSGLIGSNIIFGLMHAVTPMYAFLATAVGIYLSLLMDHGEQRNLLIPTIVHCGYDFLFFLVIVRTYLAQLTKPK